MNKNSMDFRDLKYYELSASNPLVIKLQQCKSKKLYHYTTADNSKSILESNLLWVSHSNYLDDKMEIRYISTVLDGVIEYLKKEKQLYDIGFNHQWFIYNTILKTLEAQRDEYKHGLSLIDGHIFLLSLTDNNDNKYLIEHYCNQQGTVLEFENKFNDILIDNKGVSVFLLAKVEYNLEKQMLLIIDDINEFYEEILNNFNDAPNGDYIKIIETIKYIICVKMFYYSVFFKHRKFSKEEEIRVAFLVENNNNQSIKFREVSDKKIPYIEIKLKEKSILNTINV